MGRIKKSTIEKRKTCITANKVRWERYKVSHAVVTLEKQKRNANLMISSLFDGNNSYCSHIRIGSSNVYKLLNGSLTAYRVHHAEKYFGSHQKGDLWERYFAKWTDFENENGEIIKFRIIDSQKFYRSNDCLFLAAIPDFVIEFTRNDGKKEIGLAEIKSTNRPKNFATYVNGNALEQRTQLQIALQCSELPTGFLIFIHGDKEEPLDCEDISYKVYEVKNEKKYLSFNRNKLLEGLGRYISMCASYPSVPDPELQEYVRTEIMKQRDKIIIQKSLIRTNVNLKNELPITPPRLDCKINKLIKIQYLKKTNSVRRRGRPRLKFKELKRERTFKKYERCDEVYFGFNLRD